jgi:hypothetical protein
MQFHAKYVSAAEAGDYYQVSFETEDPGDDATNPPGLDSPYLIIQRQLRGLPFSSGGRSHSRSITLRIADSVENIET